MTEDKTKVKDLATELGVPTKNLLQALRELDIPAKSTSSNIAAEDIDRVKNHLKDSATSEQGDRREVQPGVIVRRRRQSTEDVAAEGEEAPRAERRAPRENHTPTARIVSVPGASEAQDAAPVPSAEPEAPAAPEVSVQEPVKDAAEEKPAPVAEADKADDQKPRQPRDNRQKKRSGLREAAPVAKVISRPQDIAAAKAAEEAAAKAAAEAVAAAAKAAAEAAAAAKKTEEAEKPRKAQPAASARPEGSSAPSLLPPVSEGNRSSSSDGEDDDRRDRRKPRRPQEPATPQVRVISRPDPAAVAAARTQQAAQSDGRDNRNAGRDGQARDGRPGQPRDGRPGQGRDDNRPARTGYQGPRPASGGAPGNFTPGATPGGPLPDRDGQSKKKRNKTARRTVDFQDTANNGRRRSDDMDDVPRRGGRRRPKASRVVSQATQPLKAVKRKIRIEEAIRVADMAHQMGLKSNEIIKVLFNLGIMATINKALDIDTASVVAAEFGYEVEKVGFAEEQYLADHRTEDSPEQLKRRPPVVTIMGHVDHGKTSLLDRIRRTNVAAGEAGGITQHIGAYRVMVNGKPVTFLDTPGHEAFTSMRARGAMVTDIAILVVAADDGIMPQTIESINHAKAAGIPLVVAINKMDVHGANPDRIKQQLTEYGLVPEEWGGETIVCPISAKTGEGVDKLLENLVLLAEILELKANPNRAARGTVIEARMDKGRGPIMTVLVQNGTLHQGDIIIAGTAVGRVRTMTNDKGQRVTKAGPSIPVEIAGMSEVPSAGDKFNAVADERMARELVEERKQQKKDAANAGSKKVSLDDLFSRIQQGEMKDFNIIVKADVQGSAEAVKSSLEKLSNDEVRVQVIHSGVGAINESDVMLAATSNAIIVGFNVRPDAAARDNAARSNVEIRMYRVIYDCINEIEAAMKGMLAPKFQEQIIGHVEIRQTFKVSKVGTVCGGYVTDGKIVRNSKVRVVRDNIVVFEGDLASLRRFKDDVKEVAAGYECGLQVDKYNDVKVGDVIEVYVMEEIKQ